MPKQSLLILLNVFRGELLAQCDLRRKCAACAHNLGALFPASESLNRSFSPCSAGKWPYRLTAHEAVIG
ncbi:hypothetical protein OF122_06180 [Pelagibacterium flavum]|uniref:Secreted protein n=1 Tax=Pelagibacterium flavum TaxID=2984530 RepID=A0ABY6ISA0_9HYPH|nr:hypothetical protein [Pelagibacterium sp. YIM 151497]UYQ73346.1 hypothetical protein OF122_06180 [Pelagibacterium sp. YIM 151497]